MKTTQAYPTVGQAVAERPAAARIFERLGLDYCCGGKEPLDQACAARGLNVEKVLQEVDAAGNAAPGGERDWLHASLTELSDHIVATHHAFLRRELPRLAALAAKVAQVHGPNRPELPTVARIFDGLRAELEQHMLKDQAQARPAFHCGSVANPIAVMEREHEGAGDALHRIRELTENYTPPECACASYRALLAGLAELENDLHQHIHKENNILFPRAIAREAELAGCPE
jgi:regulator of cell morphogenesis and NO signaling